MDQATWVKRRARLWELIDTHGTEEGTMSTPAAQREYDELLRLVRIKAGTPDEEMLWSTTP